MNLKLWCVLVCTTTLIASCVSNEVAGPPGPIESPQLKTGEQWRYDERNGYNGALINTWLREVAETKGTSTTLRFTDKTQTKEAIVDHLDGGLLQEVFPGGEVVSYAQPLLHLPSPIAPGASWQQRVAATDSTGKKNVMSLHAKARGWERVTVPAGEFVALKIVKDLYLGDAEWWRSQTRRTIVDWYAPEVKTLVRRTTSDEYRDLLRSRDSWFFDDQLIRGDRYVWELTSYQLAKDDKAQRATRNIEGARD